MTNENATPENTEPATEENLAAAETELAAQGVASGSGASQEPAVGDAAESLEVSNEEAKATEETDAHDAVEEAKEEAKEQDFTGEDEDNKEYKVSTAGELAKRILSDTVEGFKTSVSRFNASEILEKHGAPSSSLTSCIMNAVTSPDTVEGSRAVKVTIVVEVG